MEYEYGGAIKKEYKEMATQELEELKAFLESENEFFEKELKKANSQQALDIRNDISGNNMKIQFIEGIIDERSINKKR